MIFKVLNLAIPHSSLIVNQDRDYRLYSQMLKIYTLAVVQRHGWLDRNVQVLTKPSLRNNEDLKERRYLIEDFSAFLVWVTHSSLRMTGS